MGDLMNEFMKKKAISMLRMELIITLIYIGAWGIWGIMAIVDLNVAKIFFLGMSIYIALIIHYHVPLHKWNYSGSIQAIGIISVLYAYFMIWHGFPIDWGNGTTTLFIHLFLGITKVIHNDFISISIMFLTPFVLVYVISLALFWILCALNGKNQCYQRKWCRSHYRKRYQRTKQKHGYNLNKYKVIELEFRKRNELWLSVLYRIIIINIRWDELE